jgi:hypothetical protein
MKGRIPLVSMHKTKFNVWHSECYISAHSGNHMRSCPRYSLLNLRKMTSNNFFRDRKVNGIKIPDQIISIINSRNFFTSKFLHLSIQQFKEVGTGLKISPRKENSTDSQLAAGSAVEVRKGPPAGGSLRRW